MTPRSLLCGSNLIVASLFTSLPLAMSLPDPVSSASMPSLELAPTRINGHGLWESWTRNFRSPLSALLDLIDNSCDAAALVPDFPGKIHVLADAKSGLCIINNSVNRIKDMGQILEVHHSTKGNSSDSVGENGVGLKQGVASLTDLGFVLLRNEKELSLGIIAKVLQKEDSCCLPSFNLGMLPSGAVSRNSIQHICSLYPAIANCVRQYGEDDLEYGIDRLVRHFDIITQSSEWRDWEHVFLLALHTLKHISVEQPDAAQYYVRNLMKELRDEIPRHYIHIPSSFDMRVDRHRIQFEHWQRKLVDLTRFQVNIVKDECIKNDVNWREAVHRPAEMWYSLNIYCGFDPCRANNQGSAKLLIYSRRCGRLVCFHDDARQMLGLTTGTSKFSQGLTIIVDDRDGHLPLNPTKQDIAFGEEKHGKAHKMNLEAWVGACTWTWWMVQLDACASSRDVLSKRIQEAYSPDDGNSEQTLPPLHLCTLTKFEFGNNCTWNRTNVRIRPSKRDWIQVVQGIHTIWRINRMPPPVSVPPVATVPPPARVPIALSQEGSADSRKRSRSSQPGPGDQGSRSISVCPPQAPYPVSVPSCSISASHILNVLQLSPMARQPPNSLGVASAVQNSNPSGPSGNVSPGGSALSESQEEVYQRKITQLEKQLKEKERLIQDLNNECQSLKEQLRVAKGDDYESQCVYI